MVWSSKHPTIHAGFTGLFEALKDFLGCMVLSRIEAVRISLHVQLLIISIQTSNTTSLKNKKLPNNEKTADLYLKPYSGQIYDIYLFLKHGHIPLWWDFMSTSIFLRSQKRARIISKKTDLETNTLQPLTRLRVLLSFMNDTWLSILRWDLFQWKTRLKRYIFFSS